MLGDEPARDLPFEDGGLPVHMVEPDSPREIVREDESSESQDSEEEVGDKRRVVVRESPDVATSSPPPLRWKPAPAVSIRPGDPARAYRRGHRRAVVTGALLPVPVWDTEAAAFLRQDWTSQYQNCPDFSPIWAECHDPEKAWPKGYTGPGGKLHYRDKLCVPTDRVKGLITAHHVWNAH